MGGRKEKRVEGRRNRWREGEEGGGREKWVEGEKYR